jgi:hypothetical protein
MNSSVSSVSSAGGELRRNNLTTNTGGGGGGGEDALKQSVSSVASTASNGARARDRGKDIMLDNISCEYTYT